MFEKKGGKKIISQIFPYDSSWDLLFPLFFFLFHLFHQGLYISFLLFTNLFIRVKEDKDTVSKGSYKRFYFDITTVIFLN